MRLNPSEASDTSDFDEAVAFVNVEENSEWRSEKRSQALGDFHTLGLSVVRQLHIDDMCSRRYCVAISSLDPNLSQFVKRAIVPNNRVPGHLHSRDCK
jgi:hypothetical protein